MVAARRPRGVAHTHAPPPLPARTLALNWALLALAPLPALALARARLASGAAAASPFRTANALLAGSMAFGWALSLLQASTWLIDPAWVLIPLLLDLFYAAACPASAPSRRAALISALTLLWGLRLQHSYFRRERWRPGAREDWRYEEMRRKMGGLAWAVASAGVVYALQQGLLVGLALPHYAARCVPGVSAAPLAWRTDGPWVVLAVGGLALAKAADDQLFAYGAAPASQKPIVLDTGVWAWSRHPNYVGETAFHAALAGLAATAGRAAGGGGSAAPWAAVGALANTACLLGVTAMTEARTAARPGRAAAWREYCGRVPCWVGVVRRKARRG